MIIAFLFLFLLPALSTGEFKFPPHSIELLSPVGFKVSVPDVPGATLFAVHINVNEEMDGLDAGQFSADVVKKKNGRWTYFNRRHELRNGDKLYYWLYLIINGLGYRLDNQEYVVSGASSSTSSPTTPSGGDPLIDIRIPECSSRSVTRFGKSQPCSKELIFSDNFSEGLDKWSHEVTFSDSPESDFTIWTKDYGTSGLSNSYLSIKPKLLEDVSNSSFVNTGTLELKGCTSKIKNSCLRSAYSWSILPPIVSSRLTSKNSFSFLYGEVEIRAKLPKGDWIVPELWLESKEVFYGSQSGRLFLGKVVGNPSLKDKQNEEIGGSLLLQGYSLDNKKDIVFKKKNNNFWFNDFHTYKLRWAPDSVTFYVDGEEIHRVAPSGAPLNSGIEGSTPLAPFDREFYVSLGVHVGGRVDFPDGSVSNGKSKPWHNNKIKHVLDFWQHKDDWYSTWDSANSQLLVDYVKVYAL